MSGSEPARIWPFALGLFQRFKYFAAFLTSVINLRYELETDMALRTVCITISTLLIGNEDAFKIIHSIFIEDADFALQAREASDGKVMVADAR